MEEIGLEAVMNIAGFTAGMNSYMSQLRSASGLTASSASTMGAQYMSLGNTVLKAVGVTAVAGFAAFTAGIGYSIREASAAQQVQAQLAAVIESTGGAAGVSADDVNKYADSLSMVTTFEDEAIIEGEALLLTFTNIGKDVFPQATETMLDMSQALGQDMKGSAVQLGKALNDPIKGITALSRVGVNFTEEQKNTIKTLVEEGNVLEAQKLILAELSKEFGGSAKAAGKTFAGQLVILKNALSNVAEAVGTALLPVLQGFVENVLLPSLPTIQALGDALADVFTIIGEGGSVQDVFESLGDSLQEAGLISEGVREAFFKVGEVIGTAFGKLGDFVTDVIVPFAKEHLPELKGALAGVGALLASAGIAAAVAGIGAALAGLLSPINLLIAASALLGAAWAGDWLGIRTALTGWWETSGKPIFDQLVGTLSVFLPQAIATLTEFWNTTLLPMFSGFGEILTTSVFPLIGQLFTWLGTNLVSAIQKFADWWTNTALPASIAFWGWVQTTVFPIIQTLFAWLATNLPIAIQTLSNFWSTVLWPAIQGVWNWVQTTVFPIIQTLFDWLAANLPSAIQTLSNFWNNVLWPAIQGVWNWVSGTLFPIAQQLYDWLSARLSGATQTLSDVWNNTLLPAFQAVSDFVTGSLVPFFTTLGELVGELMRLGSEVLAGVWNDLLLPALTAVGDYIQATLQPVWDTLSAFFTDTIQPALETLGSFLQATFQPIIETLGSYLSTTFSPAVKEVKTGAIDLLKQGLDALSGVFDSIRGKVQTFVDTLKGLDWETIKNALKAFLPGSLPPLAQGFVDIAAKALELAGKLGGGLLTALKDIADIVKTFTKDFWNKTFLVPWENIEAFLDEKFIPTLNEVIGKLETEFPQGVGVAAAALNVFLQKSVLPVNEALDILGNLIGSVGDKIASATAPYSDFLALTNSIIGAQEELISSIGSVSSAMAGAEKEMTSFSSALGKVVGAINNVIGAIGKLNGALAGVSLPAPFEPGSPSPFEISLNGINSELTPMVGHVKDVARSLGKDLFDALRAAFPEMDELTGEVFDLKDQLLDLGSAIGSIGGGFVNQYKRIVLGGIDKQMSSIDQRLAMAEKWSVGARRAKDILGSDFDVIRIGNYLKMLQEGKWAALGLTSEQQAREMEYYLELQRERLLLESEYAQKEREILELQERQAKLDYLKSQIDLLKLLQEYGLNPDDFFPADFKFGLDADPGEFMDIIKGVMDAIIASLQGELTAPTGLLGAMASGIAGAFSQLEGMVMPPLQHAVSMAQAAGGSTTTSTPLVGGSNYSVTLNMGGVTIYGEQDAALFEHRIRQIIADAIGE